MSGRSKARAGTPTVAFTTEVESQNTNNFSIMLKPSNFQVSEFSLTPKAVVVHNPTDYHVFSHLENLPIQELQKKYLFRTIPNAKQFREAHQAFANSLNGELKDPGRLSGYVKMDHVTFRKLEFIYSF